MSAVVEAPEGFELRRVPRAAAATVRQRPAAEWRRQLKWLLDCGADKAWVSAKGAPFTGSEPTSLAARGALLIADRGSRKMYRLTDYGVRVAQGRS